MLIFKEMYMFQEMFEKATAKPTIEVSSLVKDNWYMIDLMGMNVRARLMESPKQGRGYKSVVMMDVRGSDVGMFDEMGSVYVTDIVSEYAE
jgi:hypothetical protein